MPTLLVFSIVTAIVGGLLLLGAIIAVLRERGPQPGDEPGTAGAVGKYEADAPLTATSPFSLTSASGGVVRVIWWVMVVGVLISVGLSGIYAENRTPIYAVGAVAVIAVVALREVLPASRRTPVIGWLEVAIALALAAALLLLTGYGGSPFAFSLSLVAVAVALAGNEWAAAAVALLASGVFAGVTALDPSPDRFATAGLVQIAVNVGAIWLLTLLAAVFARNERRIHEMLSRLSRIDPLTGLLNRTQLRQTLEDEVRRTRRSERGFSLLMMDLDGLKAVNDGLGHQRGDEVLRELGRVIRDDIRTVDSAYRYGGDEFLVLLPETDYAGAFVVAEKIRSDAEERGLRLEPDGIATSLSIGLVSHPEDGGTADELVRAADRAMYNAKALGKNQISGYPRPPRPASGHAAAATTTRASSGGPGDPSPGHGGSGRGAAPSTEQTMAASGAGDPAKVAVAEEPTPAPVVEIAEEWVTIPDPQPALMSAVAVETGADEEPDAAEVRRRIAVASRSFDPDDQVLAAMEAFLSPPSRPTNRPD